MAPATAAATFKKAAAPAKSTKKAAPAEPESKPVAQPEETKPAEESKAQVTVNAAGQSVKKIKGPKPRGLTKFKPVAPEEQKIEETELSEN